MTFLNFDVCLGWVITWLDRGALCLKFQIIQQFCKNDAFFAAIHNSICKILTNLHFSVQNLLAVALKKLGLPAAVVKYQFLYTDVQNYEVAAFFTVTCCRHSLHLTQHNFP